MGHLVMCELLWGLFASSGEAESELQQRDSFWGPICRGAWRGDVCTHTSSIFSQPLLSLASADCPVRGWAQPSCCFLGLYPKLRGLQAGWALCKSCHPLSKAIPGMLLSGDPTLQSQGNVGLTPDESCMTSVKDASFFTPFIASDLSFFPRELV